jgi:hypothetical protein
LISGPGSLSGTTLTITGAGTIVVKASQPGNSIYAAAEVQRSIVVSNVTYAVSASISGSGSIQCVSPVISGNTTTCTLTPVSGFKISVASGCGTGILNGSTYTTGAITGNCTVTATFVSQKPGDCDGDGSRERDQHVFGTENSGSLCGSGQ